MATLFSHIQFARKLVRLLDTKFHLFGIRFGIDPLLDIIPAAGNIFAAATSCYLFWIAQKLHVPKKVYAQMFGNILLDFIFGVVPVIGVVFDVLYKSNVRNFALLERYFDPEILTGEVVNA